MRFVILEGIVLLASGIQAALGCDLAPLETHEVTSDLTVVVTHRTKPIEGIQVQVIPLGSTEQVFSGTTDAKGIVSIHGLAAGRYFVTASHEDFEAPKQLIEVTAIYDPEARDQITFQWADWSYEIRTVAGTLTGLVPGDSGNRLMDIVHPKKISYSGVQVTLKGAFSDAQYEAISDSSGIFSIDHVPEGIYVMTIPGGLKSIAGTADVTRQVLDVIRTSSNLFLPLELKDNGCGGVDFELAE